MQPPFHFGPSRYLLNEHKQSLCQRLVVPAIDGKAYKDDFYLVRKSPSRQPIHRVQERPEQHHGISRSINMSHPALLQRPAAFGS